MSIEIIIGGGILTAMLTTIVSIVSSQFYMKGKQETFITHPQHRIICHEKSETFFKEINLFKKETSKNQLEMMRLLGKIEGELKHLNGGNRE